MPNGWCYVSSDNLEALLKEKRNSLNIVSVSFDSSMDADSYKESGPTLRDLPTEKNSQRLISTVSNDLENYPIVENPVYSKLLDELPSSTSYINRSDSSYSYDDSGIDNETFKVVRYCQSQSENDSFFFNVNKSDFSFLFRTVFLINLYLKGWILLFRIGSTNSTGFFIFA